MKKRSSGSEKASWGSSLGVPESRYPCLRASLKQKINYSYSPYEGAVFLDGYLLIRNNAIQRISSLLALRVKEMLKKMNYPEQVEFIFFDTIFNHAIYAQGLWLKDSDSNADYLTKLYLDYLGNKVGGANSQKHSDHIPTITIDAKGFTTEYVLKAILLSFIDNRIIKVNDTTQIINQLLRKYEVTQQLFSSYDSSFKKVSDDSSGLINYCLLALIAADIFHRQENFRYLNLLLKINDLIAGLDCNLFDLTGLLLSLTSLKKETGIIKLLRQRCNGGT
jgi:hypothetical protein